MTETRTPYIVAAKPGPTLVIPDLREYSLDEYSLLLSLDEEEAAEFEVFLPDYTHRFRYTLNCWDMWWDRFVQMQDARDEAETLADALV
jgi:hypothetical protein